MSPLKTSLLVLLVATAACGRQVVEFGRDDAGRDASIDASSDAAVDRDGPVALRPVVTSTMPGPSATGIALATNVTATFSKPMNAGTLTMMTFTLAQGATPIVGSVMMDAANTTATFDPMFALTAGLVYTATISTGAQDAGGLGLATAHTWTFTTTGLPPTVTSTTPLPSATNTALTVSPTAHFDQTMNSATINMTTFTLTQAGTPIVGSVMLDAAGTTATFNPMFDLTAGLVYNATITMGAQGTSGMSLVAPHMWSFTAGIAGVPPTVTSTTPSPGANNVPVNVSPTATFSQPMNGATINMLTFTLAQAGTPIVGAVSYDILTRRATFNPMLDLTVGLLYTATITVGAEDTNGLALAMPHTWTFTVGSACIVAPVVLGTAGAFAVLAGSGVTNTGPSAITGDLGVWPLAAVTGFPPGVLTGTLYAGVPTAMTAQGHLTTAYNDAAGRTLCLTSLVGDIGGMTLVPGLYKSTGAFSITSANLVLDAQGDPNAVWIFSMASTLTVASSRQVTIIGGGSAANVYWQVGSSATLGTAAVFKGTIMADQTITFATGAVLDGRALARIAAVTLDTTTITRP